MYKSQGGFANFWHYNKGKIFLVVAIIAFIAFAVSQCSYGKTVTLGIFHISEVNNVDGQQFAEKLGKDLDLTAIGDSKDIQFISVCYPSDMKDAMESGAVEKISTELSNGNSNMYIMDEETVYEYVSADIFEDITAIADKYNIPAQDRYLGEDGEVCAISVDGNKYLTDSGLECNSLYIAIRKYQDPDSVRYQKCIEALELILSQR